jgi:hypothetical protein
MENIRFGHLSQKKSQLMGCSEEEEEEVMASSILQHKDLFPNHLSKDVRVSNVKKHFCKYPVHKTQRQATHDYYF